MLMWAMVWTCDGCGGEAVCSDDLMPRGWIHTMDGRDLCEECRG